MKVLKTEWLLTRRCNLRCRYCKIIDRGSLEGNELNFEQVKKGLLYLKQRFPLAPVIFFGGEPTVIEWLPDLVEFCEKIDIKYAIISNSVRVVKDDNYAKLLVSKGLSNWSVSIDTVSNYGESDADYKSYTGFQALKRFQELGVKDLVACITVSKWNIMEVPNIVKHLSKNGIWGITTPLQLGHTGFDYSGGDIADQCRDMRVITRIAETLKEMAQSGKYLMHNAPEFYDAWEKHFIELDWKCSQKSALTVDADGSLRRCVDFKGGLERFNILSLEENEKEYENALKEKTKCKGCFWDPAFETELRGKSWDEAVAYKSFRHELTEEQIKGLSEETRRWLVS